MKFIRIAVTALALSGSAAMASSQEVDTASNMFSVTTYGVEADNRCQVYDNMQRQTAQHIQQSMRGVLVGRAGEAAVAAEETRLQSQAQQDWPGCLSRADHPDEWKNIDVSRVYIDALIAAPGLMDKDIKSCAVSSASTPIERADMDAAMALADARQKQGPFAANYQQLQDMFAGAIAGQCWGQNYSPEMIGPAAIRDRNLLVAETAAGRETSLAVFGDWTSFKYFPFDDFDEFGVSAYRAPRSSTAPVASVTLTTEGALGTFGKLYAMSDGTLRADLKGGVDALEVRAGGETLASFEQSARSSENNFLASTQFTLDHAKTSALLTDHSDTSVAFIFRPSGRPDWRQFDAREHQPGRLPLSRLADGIAWATAPVAPDL